MTTTRRITRIAAWTAAGVLGAGALSGVAYAATDGPAAPPQAHQRAARHGGLLRALEHGELTLRGRNGDRTVDLQRGTASAVTATALTVTSHDGFTATYTVTPRTKVRGALRQGAAVLVVASGGTALRVVAAQASAPPAAAGPTSTA